jgi:hypothetical protein
VAPGFQHNTVCLISWRPLEPESRYTVKVSAYVNGQPWEKTWGFRTRPEGADLAAVAAAATARVNLYRRLAGLPPVSLDEDLSRGCRLHARYLLTNLDHPATRGLGMHNEDAKLPGYTPEGKATGGESVIAAGMPPVASIDDWMATFYHRVPLLEPELGRIGFGMVRGGPVGWFVVLNASSGRGREPTVVYPGEGQEDVPRKGAEGGYPVTVAFPARKNVQQVEAMLRDSEGKELAVKLLTPESSEEARAAGALVILPRDPLPPGTTCTVTVKAKIDRKPVSRTWNFRTGQK